MTAATAANRLAHETSPYLLQHAHNPVDWYAWGDEAFERARTENKPILLSIGYSACHWCHVMERESFENENIAQIMNAHFINIKVDREERPDVDAIYMSAVQMMTGQGGWPMTMFLTPDARPFFGGTYFPPTDMYGRPGFPNILQSVASAWKTERIGIESQADTILAHLEQGNDLSRDLPDSLLTPKVLENAFTALSVSFDPRYGGFGTAPKFPQPCNLDFLMRFHTRSKRQEPLSMAEKTLQKMAVGGMYDQLGGGFHRYSTDQTWLVPHFEKMLYDNAQLAQTYAHAFQITGKAFYKGVAEETLEYILREMTDPGGGFYSAQDADSEGEEGKFFVWTPDEIKSVLGETDARVFCAFYDVTQGGNWEGNSILHVVMDAPAVAQQFGLSVAQAAEILDSARIKLLDARNTRIKPNLDDKILCAWNGLALAAFAEVGAILNRQDFIDAAVKNAEFMLANLAQEQENGDLRLLRTYRNGQARLNAYLEDYAFYADGLLHLYQATFDTRWLHTAQKLVDTMRRLFHDEQHGGFYCTSNDHETLIQRPKDIDDNATPSGNSVALDVMLKLWAYTGAEHYQHCAARVLRKLGPVIEKHPYGFARLLGALDLYLAGPHEIGLRGNPTDPATRELIRAAYTPYLPNRVLALGAVDDTTSDIAFLNDRPAQNGRPTAYVCRNFACNAPVTTADALLQQLQRP